MPCYSVSIFVAPIVLQILMCFSVCAAQVRVCADGGANRVFDGMPELLPGHDPDDVRSR